MYTPIEDFSVNDVWIYLIQVQSPWGNRNLDLVTMYKNAQAGECPLVVDKTTPSCGNSRFGCWTCTVVEKNNSMEAMIDNGERWLQPMLDYRNELASTQDPDVKAQVRQLKHRNGQVMVKRNGGYAPGPYKFEVRKKLLRRLLEVQKEVRASGPNPEEVLISPDELYLIRKLWRTEAQDWEDSVPKIYREVMGQELEWVADEHPGFSSEDRSLLDTICDRHDVPSAMVAKLLDIERQFQGLSRRSAVHQRIAKVIEEDWRSEEEILAHESEPSS